MDVTDIKLSQWTLPGWPHAGHVLKSKGSAASAIIQQVTYQEITFPVWQFATPSILRKNQWRAKEERQPGLKMRQWTEERAELIYAADREDIQGIFFFGWGVARKYLQYSSYSSLAWHASPEFTTAFIDVVRESGGQITPCSTDNTHWGLLHTQKKLECIFFTWDLRLYYLSTHTPIKWRRYRGKCV